MECDKNLKAVKYQCSPELEFNILSQYTDNIIKQYNNKLNDKFEEACKLWGVDLNSHEELKTRCEIKSYKGDDKKELYIDGSLVMIFTNPSLKPFDIIRDYNDKFSVTTEFRCSEIMKPRK